MQLARGKGEVDPEHEEKCKASDGGECHQKGRKFVIPSFPHFVAQSVHEQSSNVSAVCSIVDQCLQLGECH